jgi:hypothetical protein
MIKSVDHVFVTVRRTESTLPLIILWLKQGWSLKFL